MLSFRFPMILLALLGSAAAGDEIDVALVADSECGSGEEAQCSLSALQLRGQAQASEEHTAAYAHNAGTALGPKCARFGCHSPYSRSYSCQCNPKCHDFNNCCWDYDAICAPPTYTARPTARPSARPTARPTAGPATAPPAKSSSSSAMCSAVPSCAHLSGACCPAPNGLYLGCCPESMIPHATAPPPAVVSGHKTLTVYHQTSPEACRSILATEFRIGHGGWCGNAIYFALSPEATKTKAITPHSGIGCMLEAIVDVGNKLKFPCCRYCGGPQDKHIFWTKEQLATKGYNSIEIDPGDGPEIVVYSASQILSVREIPFKPAWTPQRATYYEPGYSGLR